MYFGWFSFLNMAPNSLLETLKSTKEKISTISSFRSFKATRSFFMMSLFESAIDFLRFNFYEGIILCHTSEGINRLIQICFALTVMFLSGSYTPEFLCVRVQKRPRFLKTISPRCYGYGFPLQ